MVQLPTLPRALLRQRAADARSRTRRRLVHIRGEGQRRRGEPSGERLFARRILDARLGLRGAARRVRGERARPLRRPPRVRNRRVELGAEEAPLLRRQPPQLPRHPGRVDTRRQVPPLHPARRRRLRKARDAHVGRRPRAAARAPPRRDAARTHHRVRRRRGARSPRLPRRADRGLHRRVRRWDRHRDRRGLHRRRRLELRRAQRRRTRSRPQRRRQEAPREGRQQSGRMRNHALRARAARLRAGRRARRMRQRDRRLPNPRRPALRGHLRRQRAPHRGQRRVRRREGDGGRGSALHRTRLDEPRQRRRAKPHPRPRADGVERTQPRRLHDGRVPRRLRLRRCDSLQRLSRSISTTAA